MFGEQDVDLGASGFEVADGLFDWEELLKHNDVNGSLLLVEPGAQIGCEDTGALQCLCDLSGFERCTNDLCPSSVLASFAYRRRDFGELLVEALQVVLQGGLPPLTCCDAFSAPSGAGQYTRTFDDVFAAVGAGVITIPPGAPRANAFAERWVRTVRHELLDRTVIWNQRQLHRLLKEFVADHNEHRPHRSLNQRAPTDDTDAAVIELDHPIRRTTTCHGLINEYRPAA